MATYYVGWDVGAWQCNISTQSHDAIAVFDETFKFVSSGLGNVKDCLRGSKDFAGFLSEFAEKPDKTKFYKYDNFVIAIDAVLGWPKNFLRLVTTPKISREELNALFPKDENIKNTFIFRQTERAVKTTVKTKRNPLSAVKDQIGSQSTKALFLLKYLEFEKNGCSEWRDDCGNIAIETYPGAVLKIHKQKMLATLEEKLFKNYKLLYPTKGLKKDLLWGKWEKKDKNIEIVDVDLQDAIVCAWVAYQYHNDRCNSPDNRVVDNYSEEGWIFLPEGDDGDLQ